MYIHKNHLIKSPGLYTISVKKLEEKKLFSLSVLQMESELSNLRLFFRLRLCLFEPGKKKKLYSLPGRDCYLCFETI